MYKHVHRLAWVVALAMLFHSLYFWGGVALTPNVGDRVLMQAQKQIDCIGVAFYAHTGKSIFNLVLTDSARDYAAREVGAIYPSLDGEAHIAAQRLRASMDQLQSFSHYGTPWAFFVAGLLYWRRPKPLKSMGR
jgi:hypothetical protein